MNAAILRAMKADAREANIRAGFSAKPTYVSRHKGNSKRESLGNQVFDYVLAHGPALTREIYPALGIKAMSLYNAIPEARRIAGKNGYTWHTRDVKLPDTPRARQYWVTK